MNEGSDVEQGSERDILARERTRYAAERTLSAWIRTGLASVGGGFAMIRFLVFENAQHRMMAKVIGEVLIIWGICIMIFALYDYKANVEKLGGFLSKRHRWWVTATISIFVVVSLFLLFISINPYSSSSPT